MGDRGTRIALTGLAFGGLVLSAACAPTQASQELRPGAAAGYFPLRPDLSWTYRVSDDRGRSRDLPTRVEGPVFWGAGSGGPVFAVHSELLDGSVLRWERRLGDEVACVQEEVRDSSGTITMEEAYDPPVIVIDERPAHLSPGAEGSETFMDTTPNYKGHPRARAAKVKWTVESTNDRVTVPAGTFTCLRVRRVRKHRPPTVSWYAKGVGLVKELGAGPLGDETLALIQAMAPK